MYFTIGLACSEPVALRSRLSFSGSGALLDRPSLALGLRSRFGRGRRKGRRPLPFSLTTVSFCLRSEFEFVEALVDGASCRTQWDL